MRAYRLHEYGFEGLRIDDLPEPKAGHGQALVKMRACSLNYRDLMVIQGKYSRNLPLPLIPFSDGVGEVVAIGEGVTRVKVGDRVAGAFMTSWVDGPPREIYGKSALGGSVDGMLAEFRTIDAEGLVVVPESLSDEEAATLPCAAVTAWHAIFVEGTLKPGETVLIQGTGGVSIFALQLARMAGARVIATSSRDEKLQKVREMGASDGINYKSEPDWGDRARKLTGGFGVDLVVEVGGAGTLAQSIRAARTGGRIALIGVLTGGEVDPRPLLMKNIRLQGIFVGSRAMFEDLNRAIVAGGLKPVVDRVFPFDQAIDALKYQESGAHFGKVVVRF